MKEESQLIKDLQSILHKEYGYSTNQMGFKVSLGTDSQRIADLVVFDQTKSPIIIAKIKKSRFILPLSEYQLRELLLESRAHFGILYNGQEKRAYKIIGSSLVQIKDIPKAKSKVIEKFKPFALPQTEIWRIAESVRGNFRNYDPLLQVLALKILDEERFNGKLFEKYHTDPFDNSNVIELIEIGKRNFPNIFYYQPDFRELDKFIRLIYTIKDFSLQNSNVDTITKAILKFSLDGDWLDFPEELSNFMLQLLSIQKE